MCVRSPPAAGCLLFAGSLFLGIAYNNNLTFNLSH
jgi:hypothetical protein